MMVSNLQLAGKNIAFFHQSSDLYGSDRILLQLAEGVQCAGAHAVVVLPEVGALTEQLKLRNIEFHVLPILKLSKAKYSVRGMVELFRELPRALAAYKKVFNKRRIDLVHSNTIAVLGGAVFAWQQCIPHLWHVHEIVERPAIASYGFAQLLNAMATHVVCNSNATYSWMVHGRPSLGKKAHVIHNGIIVPKFINEGVAEELRIKLRPEGVRFAVGLVGRINRLKGHHLLVEAADLLHSLGVDNFSLVFIGSPPPDQDLLKVQLEQRIERSPICSRIMLTGFMSDVWPAYKALDLICVPSTEPESFGLVAAEAMAMGKPVLVAKIGALGELVADEHTGVTFAPGDVNALAMGIKRILDDDEMRVRMGSAAKSSVLQNFSSEKMTERFVNIYSDLLAHKNV